VRLDCADCDGQVWLGWFRLERGQFLGAHDRAAPGSAVLLVLQ
jgi:hypothetical protein